MQHGRHTRIDTFRSALFATLGLLPLAACDSSVETEGAGGGGTGGSGTTSVGVTGSPTSTSSSSGGASLPCENPTPLVVDGVDTGVDSCEDGGLRRREAIACPSLLPRESACDDGGIGDCTVDADCGEPLSTCGYGNFDGTCSCQPGCATDADCGEGRLCLCGEPIGRCVAATCASGEDCGGLDCRSHDPEQGCGSIEFACQTPLDTCSGDGECDGGYCNVQEGGERICVDGGCAIGRPFLVEEAARLAPVTSRADWREAIAPDVAAVPVALRAELAERWTLVARMEHASIAAFARFSLQLLALGAPVDLVERSNRAAADETAHARAAFAIAGAYAGRAIGPDRLRIDGALDGADDLAELVRLVVREGCVGETVAAIEATEAEGRCVDPAVRRVLGRIAREEGEHAELAWRTVRWALAEGDSRVHDVLLEEIARLRAEAESTPPPTTRAADEQLLSWGVATEALRAALRASALERVVLPALTALVREATQRAA